MKARDFCYWLQGYFEILGSAPDDTVGNLCEKRVTTIKNHLAMVFKHEIDPSFGGLEVRKALSEIHEGDLPLEPSRCQRCSTVIGPLEQYRILLPSFDSRQSLARNEIVCKACFDAHGSGTQLNC